MTSWFPRCHINNQNVCSHALGTSINLREDLGLILFHQFKDGLKIKPETFKISKEKNNKTTTTSLHCQRSNTTISFRAKRRYHCLPLLIPPSSSFNGGVGSSMKNDFGLEDWLGGACLNLSIVFFSSFFVFPFLILTDKIIEVESYGVTCHKWMKKEPLFFMIHVFQYINICFK